MKKIKILVDCHTFGTFYSGVTTYIKGIHNELINYEEVEIYLASSAVNKLSLDFPDPRFTFVELKNTSYMGRHCRDFPRIIKKYGIDYAHFQYTIPSFKQCKYIVTIHDILFEDFPGLFPLSYRMPRSMLFRLSAKKADMVLTVSEYSRRQISAHYGIPCKDIIVTPNGVCGEYGAFQKGRADTKGGCEPYILYVSRLEPRKNHKMLIEVFAELNLHEQYRLILIGRKCIRDNQFDRCMKGLDKQVTDKILHIDNTADEKLREYYKNASLFVYPSIAEGFGIPPLEAIMSGTKTICSNATAMRDYDFFDGYQFDPLDKEALKQLMLKTLDDKNYPLAKIQSEIKSRYNWTVGAKVIFDAIMKDAGLHNKQTAQSNNRTETNNLAFSTYKQDDLHVF